MTGYEERPSQGLNAAVAATLNGERVASGLTFEGLAELTGISKRQLMRLLSTTERALTVSVIERVAAAVDLTVPDVMARAEDRLARTDPDVYDAIRRNQRLGNQLSQKRTTGPDRGEGRTKRPS